MRNVTRVLVVLSLLLMVGTNARGEDQVLTIYFCGTGIKRDAYLAANSSWNQPELLTTLFRDADGSVEIDNAVPAGAFNGKWVPTINPAHSGPHHKYIVNGAGTSPGTNIWDILSALFGTADPNLGERTWLRIKEEAMDALFLVHTNHPGTDIILNLVGYSRGGISIMQMARTAATYDYVKKINMLAYDPVPGGFDPVGSFFDDFKLGSKVNQYVGIYAEHERTYQFEPVIPQKISGNTKMLIVRVPGSHETLMGNLQVDGHSITLSGPNVTPNLENPGFHYVSDTARVIAEQLLNSTEWGSVPFSVTSAVDSKADFGSLVTNMWSQDYQWIPLWAFYPAFGTYDLCYALTFRDHHLRFVMPTFVLHGRLCFVAPNRHLTEWAWSCMPWPVLFISNEQVYWLNNVVPAINADTWDVLQSFRGAPLADTVPPSPNIAELPPIMGECSVSITNLPTATDNVAGVITATTTDPLVYTEQGMYTITWTYDDGNGNTTTQTQMVIVEDTVAPVVDADELPAVQGVCSAELTTIPTATDNCAGEVSATTTDPLVYTEQGTYTITWTYDDGNGNTTTQTQMVIVEDTVAPVIESVSASPDVLWPPNHKMVPVSIQLTVTDNCDELPLCGIVSVSNSDPENGTGDGNSEPDWEIVDTLSVNLRAERSGNGKSGREYTINIECVDAAGNSADGAVSVAVPHDNGKNK